MVLFKQGLGALISSALVALAFLLSVSGCGEDGEDTGLDATDVVSDQADMAQPDGDTGESDTGSTHGPTISQTDQSDCLVPQMTVGPTNQGECIEEPPGQITVGPTTQSECLGGPGPYIAATEQSECIDEPSIGPTHMEPCPGPGEDLPDLIEAETAPGRIHLVHYNTTHNCCGLVEMTLEMEGTTLTVTENEVFDDEHLPCYCVCEFELSADIKGLAGGTYDLVVVDGITEEPYLPAMSVTLPGPQPVFRAEGGPGVIHLSHYGAEHNCCAEVSMQFAVDGTNISVWEIEEGDPCDCVCNLDLEAGIMDLAAGTYQVQLLDDAGGNSVGDPISAEVGEPEEHIRVEVFEDTIDVYHLSANWNCCGQVEMQVSVQGDMILVEEVETAATDGYPCRCTCEYDLMVAASGFEQGEYTLRVFTRHGGDTTVFDEVDVSIPGSPEGGTLEEEVTLEAVREYTLEVTHSGAPYNCCSEIVIQATLDESTISVQEVITNDELCFCVCQFDLSAELRKLMPGEYTVEVNAADGTAVGSATESATGSGTPSFPPDEVVLSRSGSSFSIEHHSIEYDCCAVVQFELDVQGTTLDIIEIHTNPEDACDCTCHFDLQATVNGLDDQEDYTVRLWTEGRIALLHQEVLGAE